MVTAIAVLALVALLAVVVAMSIRNSSERATGSRLDRAAADIWFYRTWRRVDGALVRGQIKREGLRLRRELRQTMDRTEE